MMSMIFVFLEYFNALISKFFLIEIFVTLNFFLNWSKVVSKNGKEFLKQNQRCKFYSISSKCLDVDHRLNESENILII